MVFELKSDSSVFETFPLLLHLLSGVETDSISTIDVTHDTGVDPVKAAR